MLRVKINILSMLSELNFFTDYFIWLSNNHIQTCKYFYAEFKRPKYFSHFDVQIKSQIEKQTKFYLQATQIDN